MKTLRVGIASYEAMKAHTLAIARGERKPGKHEPRVWFRSVESFAKVLSARNQALLDLIAREKPESLTELAALSGRAKSNLSRTFRIMERYGLVALEKGAQGKVTPHVPYDSIQLQMGIHDAGSRKPTAA